MYKIFQKKKNMQIGLLVFFRRRMVRQFGLKIDSAFPPTPLDELDLNTKHEPDPNAKMKRILIRMSQTTLGFLK